MFASLWARVRAAGPPNRRVEWSLGGFVNKTKQKIRYLNITERLGGAANVLMPNRHFDVVVKRNDTRTLRS